MVQFLWTVNFRALGIWLLWLLLGTVFYAEVDFAKNYCKGFYYAVNVGYSIGFGVLNERPGGDLSFIFSTVYILFGAVAISMCLSCIIEHAVHGKKSPWYREMHAARRRSQRQSLLQPPLPTSTPAPYLPPFWDYIINHSDRILCIIIWLIYIIFGTGWSCGVVGWGFWEGLYFAVSSLSTGGLHGIPSYSPDWMFFVVGLYCATGVPVMVLAVGALGSMLVEHTHFLGDKACEEYEVINATLSAMELTQFDDFYSVGETPSNVTGRRADRETAPAPAPTPAPAPAPVPVSAAVAAADMATSATAAKPALTATKPACRVTCRVAAGRPQRSSMEGTMSRNAFLLITLLRLKVVDTHLVQRILDHFDQCLDVDKSGVVQRRSIVLLGSSSSAAMFRNDRDDKDHSQMSVLIDDGGLDDADAVDVRVGEDGRHASNGSFVFNPLQSAQS